MTVTISKKIKKQQKKAELAKQAAKKLAKRHRQEKNFRRIGLAAVLMGMLFLVILFTDIISKGYTAFMQTQIQLTIDFDSNRIAKNIAKNKETDGETLYNGNYRKLVSDALYAKFPDVTKRKDKKLLRSIISTSAQYYLRDLAVTKIDTDSRANDSNDLQRNIAIGSGKSAADAESPSAVQYQINSQYVGQKQDIWVIADDLFDMFHKGFYTAEGAESERLIKDNYVTWYNKLLAEGNIRTVFNFDFFTNTDSTNAELAGIWGAMKGSFYVLLVTLLLSFPIGVGAAIYLEEFAPKNRWTDLIEVNINNLAAVPSIVFGLLGLAVFLNFFGLPRSAPIVGGIVLSLMTLPTIIISSRASLKSVPPSIKDAALGVGASKMQTITHHTLPLALPGMLTGTIIGMAQALGETAPLLMIGMIAFVMSVPTGIFDNATVMPVQIFLWSDLPARGFMVKTSAAIMVLLAFLITMNAIAVILRKRFERRW
jgi:phosphate transport system permease protein